MSDSPWSSLSLSLVGIQTLHLLTPVLEVLPLILRDLLGSTKWRKRVLSSAELLPEPLMLKSECRSCTLLVVVYLTSGLYLS